MCSFGSRADLNRLGEAPVPSWIQVAVPVQVLFSTGGSKTGTVQFIGQTEFASGNWIGVELDQAEGRLFYDITNSTLTLKYMYLRQLVLKR